MKTGNLRRLGVVIATCSAVSAGTAVSSAFALSPTYTLQDGQNNQCLQANAKGKVTTAACTGATNQQWALIPGFGGDIVENNQTLACLSLNQVTSPTRESVFTTTCDTSNPDQAFGGGGTGSLIVAASVPGQYLTAGKNGHAYLTTQISGDEYQAWTITMVTD